ncbi:response regulator [Xinfangfangia sp. D13-10-4-6]|uniref:response regulator n=1 Tax=Pseudogemmobacter hezensis TaxID=2737662 RepID=UPI0015572340|nr:response regulator [Pseudogemmobacter hezensis]NPD17278.1 response regulator [Pseudogemmobacter hezensis]
MPMQMKQISRPRFRWVSAICLFLTPSLGAQLVLGGQSVPGTQELLLSSVMIWSVIVHFVLAGLFVGHGRVLGIPAIVASLFALLLLPGMPLMSRFTFQEATPTSVTALMAAVFFWVAGIGAVLVSRAAWALIPARLGGFSLVLRNPVHLTVTALVLACCFLLVNSLHPLIYGEAPRLASVSTAFAGAIYALTASALALQGIEVLREEDSDSRPAPLMVVLAFLGALGTLAFVVALPDLAPVGQIGGVGTVLLTAALASVVLFRRPALLLWAGILLTAATMAFSASQAAGGPVLETIFLALLIAVLFSIGQPAASGSDPAGEVGRPPLAVIQGFNKAAQAWIVRVNLEERALRFAGGSGESLGYGELARFDEVFSGSDFSGLIDLVQMLRSDKTRPSAPVTIQLTRGGKGQEKSNTPRLMTFEAHLLSISSPNAWIALVSQEREKELSSRLARYEQLLGEAILREERLLSIASHELRTPIAILSMLGEELKSGTDWEDVGAGFERTLDRIIAILDDLRAGSGTGGGHLANTGFTLREMAQQVLDIFSTAAVSNGITLRFTSGKDSDTLLQSDHNRVFIALSKLAHNAIIHSRGHEVVISAFVTKGAEDERIVTWQVTDDGIGVDPGRHEQIFEPFESSTDNPEERPGLGLYTARKAIRLMGGELTLTANGNGSRFVLTHPARIARPLVQPAQKVITMNDITPVYEGRSVLLVEDNKLVGEITATRLRKLFSRVDWAESGDAGLMLFRENRYDMVVVDQLMPGLIGSELVREIRQTEKTMPVIGITASTMGSECRDLEEAGANYALEKPLSFGQLKSLAEEFFGDAAG